MKSASAASASARDSLRERATAGISWKLAATLGSFVVQFAIGVVLARLLAPSDFGLFGLALIATQLGELFVTLGMGPALIQRDSIEVEHVRVAFTVSVGLGFLVTWTTYAAAPFAAIWLGDPRVVPILRVVGFGFALAGLSAVGQALLTRELAFRRLGLIELGAIGLSGVLGIGLAVAGQGVWSLVWSLLARRALEAAAIYAATGHSLRPSLSTRAMRELFRFGAGISLARICNYVALQGDYFVVGRMIGPTALGLYSRAYSLMTLPTSRFVQALGSVLFPLASRLRGQPQRFGEAYRFTLGVMGLVMIPALTVMVLLSPEIVLGLYGDRWVGAVEPLQILSAFGAFRGLYNGSANFVRAKGWVYRILGCQLVYAVSIVGGSWWAAPQWGLHGVAWVVGGSIFLMWALMSVLANRATRTTPAGFARTLVPGSVLGVAVALGCEGMKLGLDALALGPIGRLVGGLLGAGGAGLAGILWLPQSALGHLPHRLLLEAERSLSSAVSTRASTTGRRLFARLLQHFERRTHESRAALSPLRPTSGE